MKIKSIFSILCIYLMILGVISMIHQAVKMQRALNEFEEMAAKYESNYAGWPVSMDGDVKFVGMATYNIIHFLLNQDF